MLDGTLIRPDNRALGGATHDFSLYGAQTPTGFSIAPDRSADKIEDRVEHPAAASGEAASPSQAVIAAPEAAEQPHAFSSDSVALASSPAATSLISAPIADMAALTAPAVPQPSGSGSVAPLPPVQILQSHDNGATSDAASSTAASTTHAPDIGETAAPQLSTIQDAVAEAATSLSQIPVVSEVTAPLGQLPADVTTSLAQIGEDVAQLGSQVATPVADLDSTISHVESVIDGLTQSVSNTIETVVAPVAPALDGAVSGPLSDGAPVAQVEDTLDDVVGADPAGGIATLVSLVSVSDVFDLNDSGHDVSTPYEPVPGLLDSLTADVPDTDALLDTGHHDEGSGLDDGLHHLGL